MKNDFLDSPLTIQRLKNEPGMRIYTHDISLDGWGPYYSRHRHENESPRENEREDEMRRRRDIRFKVIRDSRDSFIIYPERRY